MNRRPSGRDENGEGDEGEDDSEDRARGALVFVHVRCLPVRDVGDMIVPPAHSGIADAPAAECGIFLTRA